MREEGVVLEHDADAPGLGRHRDALAGDALPAELDRARVGGLESRDEAQRGARRRA
jgi:hypothetical protein